MNSLPPKVEQCFQASQARVEIHAPINCNGIFDFADIEKHAEGSQYMYFYRDSVVAVGTASVKNGAGALALGTILTYS